MCCIKPSNLSKGCSIYVYYPNTDLTLFKLNRQNQMDCRSRYCLSNIKQCSYNARKRNACLISSVQLEMLFGKQSPGQNVLRTEQA
jgi:hypothetical protein